MAVRAKEMVFDVDVASDGAATRPDGDALTVPEGWTPEHLLLAALARCSLASLGYSARRAGVTIDASAHAHGVVSRDEDGRFRFTSIDVHMTVGMTPALDGDALAKLQRFTERGCFIGASLGKEPSYHWTVTGTDAPTRS